MRVNEIKQMLDEYNGNYGGDFKAYVDSCAKAAGTDAIAIIHKATTFEYFNYLKANGRVLDDKK